MILALHTNISTVLETYLIVTNMLRTLMLIVTFFYMKHDYTHFIIV